MKTMKKRHKVTLLLLLAVIVIAGALLYLRTLEREEIEEKPDSAPIIQEEVLEPDDAAERKDGEAESEPEEEEDLRVKVGPDEFPVIFEDGDYENLDKANLIWTVNNLFASGHDFEIIEEEPSVNFHVSGREEESNLYLYGSGRGYRPKIEIRYNDIVEVDGVNHLVLSREFIEAFIETPSKYAEVTDELNNFIDRLNRINSVEIDNLTEAQIDSMYYIDPNINEVDFDLEVRREGLREFTVDSHFKSTNVFWIEELPEEDIDFLEDEAESMLLGQAIYYKRKDNLPWWVPDDKENLELTPPSNFNPRLHTDPDAESFIWIPANKWMFLYDKGQWKIAIFRGPP